MGDREVVVAIAAGDPAGIREAYDRHSAELYSYCYWMLREPADAATALRDLFVHAATTSRALPEPPGLRPWLYSVARNECRNRLRTRLSTDGQPADAAERQADADPAADGAVVADRDQGQPDPIRRAIAELEPGEREIIELDLRHEIYDADLATVLRVSRRQARSLAIRAFGNLDKAIAPDHAVLRRAVLSEVIPMAALTSQLRDEVLRLCSSPSPDAVAYRRRLSRRRYARVLPVAWVAVVWVVGISLIVLTRSHPVSALTAKPSDIHPASTPAATASSAPFQISPSPTHHRSRKHVRHRVTRSAPSTAHGVTTFPPSHSPSRSPSPGPSKSKSPSPKPSKSPSPSPSPSHSPSPSPSPSATQTTPPG